MTVYSVKVCVCVRVRNCVSTWDMGEEGWRSKLGEATGSTGLTRTARAACSTVCARVPVCAHVHGVCTCVRERERGSE